MILKMSNYYKPTPAKIRKIADALLGASLFITTSSLISNYNTLAVISLITGAICKFVSNLTGDDNVQ